MHYLKDMCTVCMRFEHSMQDLKARPCNDSGENLVDKLNILVSEIKWPKLMQILVCNPCVDRLNSAFEFKRQCLNTTKVLLKYETQLRGGKSLFKNVKVKLSKQDIIAKDVMDSYAKQQKEKDSVAEGILAAALQASPVVNPFLPILSDEILQTSDNIGFFSETPTKAPAKSRKTKTLKQVKTPAPKQVKTPAPKKAASKKADAKNAASKKADAKNAVSKNLSVYMNINNEYHKMLTAVGTNTLPQASLLPEVPISSNGTGQTEELSIDLDPSIFDCTPEVMTIPESGTNAWEDLISSNTICPNSTTTSLIESQQNLEELLSIGHFMAPINVNLRNTPKKFPCVQCGKSMETFKALNDHIHGMHSGRFPFNCTYCSETFALSSHLEVHVREHSKIFSSPSQKDMLTLEDVSTRNESELFPINIGSSDEESDMEYQLPAYYAKVSELDQQPKKVVISAKKYVKGRKNAKCPICDREFSTQSYLQAHIKLHYRKGDYRMKVHGGNANITPTQIDFENEIAKTQISGENGMKSPEELSSSLRGLLQASVEIDDDDDDDCIMISPSPVEKLQEGEVLGENGFIGMSDVSADSTDCGPGLKGKKSKKEEDSPSERRPPYLQLTTESGKPQCNICLKEFSRRHDLKRHMNNIHLKTIQYTCHLCDSYFYEAFHLTRHLRIHVGFVKCTACFKDFSAVRDLKFHIMGSHDNCASGQCGMCGQHFQRIKHLREHMQEHENSILYKCHICGEEFRESRELTRHLVGHSGMYSCNLCSTTLSNEHELSNHMKCHTENTPTERKYPCSFCSNRYKEKRYLNLHMRNVHPVEYANI